MKVPFFPAGTICPFCKQDLVVRQDKNGIDIFDEFNHTIKLTESRGSGNYFPQHVWKIPDCQQHESCLSGKKDRRRFVKNGMMETMLSKVSDEDKEKFKSEGAAYFEAMRVLKRNHSKGEKPQKQPKK